jgi:hypothetical protein
MPVILATQEAESRRTVVQSQPKQIVCKTLSQKALHKNRTSEVVQGEGPELVLKKKKICVLLHNHFERKPLVSSQSRPIFTNQVTLIN